ncbi:phosphoribosyl-AMP cyclohydrolase [Mongoliitalea lutea]|uniref:Histidine biosynthesis bifunctional protein HisIE n=1 Tax=Mongoliitalea lutea TaxID=849756 RepID=A0A8J3D045_9BACT|nr:phosphoribosyl-AMP cyclohydrolase [Mongoliitalea lutea]GHB46535.1 phosphoribosyl-AMP cyclohydrolase [Mongoliitalea lutea]
MNIEETSELVLQFQKRGGILPVAVQEYSTGQILMLASVNQEALEYSVKFRIAAFYSTSRKKLWVKGESSGNQLRVEKILIDCDQDALVYQVTILGGGVCHTFNKEGNNRKACFYRSLDFDEMKLQFLEK